MVPSVHAKEEPAGLLVKAILVKLPLQEDWILDVVTEGRGRLTEVSVANTVALLVIPAIIAVPPLLVTLAGPAAPVIPIT